VTKAELKRYSARIAIDLLERKRREFREGFAWDHWRFERMGGQAFVEHMRTGYAIPCSDMTCSAKVLDWIVQISRKNRVYTNEEVGELVRIVDHLIDCQGQLCGCGVPQTIDAEAYFRGGADVE
jgi:hypothetical protein